MPVFTNDVPEARQQKAAAAFGDNAPIVVIGAGKPIQKPGGLDQTYPFDPHPEYYWLTGSRRWGGAIAYDPADGWTHFVRPAHKNEYLWEGTPEVPDGEDVAGLTGWLKARSDRPLAVLGSPLDGITGDPDLAGELRERLDTVRRRKDAAEIRLVERAAKATAAAHARAREVIRPGVTEREIQIEVEAAMFREGAEATGFGTIVGAGTNAAVLHFTPGDREVGEEDLVLIDMGGRVSGYTADVTRTYSAGERFTPRQQAIYDVVLSAEQAGISCCKVGTEWHDVHRQAARVIAEGLRDLGILVGEVDGILESGVVAMFFPHGVGHMVGLGVRDVGGRAPDREPGRKCCGVPVRVDLPLEQNLLMTVEPGIYFVSAMLDDPERREQFSGQVNWGALDVWRPVGGVRIEDNVLVTPGEPRVMTAEIPK
jgi:Xaa-Pro aminopeptidase